MAFPANKTKLVCTVGPASDSPAILQQMLLAGMNVVRLNFSHGDFPSHQKTIQRVRAASQATGRHVAIMADLPGPKMRIGQIAGEPVQLKPGDSFTLTTEEMVGDAGRVSVSFSPLPKAVRPGDKLYINDGYVELEVDRIAGTDVHCKVLVGGRLRSTASMPSVNPLSKPEPTLMRFEKLQPTWGTIRSLLLKSSAPGPAIIWMTFFGPPTAS